MERFQKLKFNVQKIDPHKPIEDQFPSFFKNKFYPGFEDKKALPLIFSYIVYLFDPNSELFAEFETDISKRKMAAATEACFPRDKEGNMKPYYQDVIDFKNEQVNKLILHFLRLAKDNLYREIITKQVQLDRHTSRIWQLVNDEDPDYKKIRGAEEFRDKLESEISKKILKFKQDYDDLKDDMLEMFITPENVYDAIPEIKADVEENKRGYY